MEKKVISVEEGLDALHTMASVRVQTGDDTSVVLKDSLLRPHLDILTEFVYRDVPQKIIVKVIWGHKHLVCPICDVDVDGITKYCANCGQRLEKGV